MVGARIANGLLLAAGLAILLGAAAFAVGGGVWSWSDLTSGVRWYAGVQGRSPAVLAASALAALIGAAVLVLTLRGRPERRRARSAGAGALLGRRAVDARHLHRARWRLDREICRPTPQIEKVVDSLLGALIDLEARALLLERADRVGQVAFDIGIHLPFMYYPA